MTNLETDKLYTRGALRIAFAYAVFAALWIMLSDQLMGVLFQAPETLVRANMAKGWFFVAVTTVLLYVLVRRLLSRLGAAHRRELDLERDRRQAPAILTAIAESTDTAIVVKDPDGRYLLCTQTAARLLGRRVEDVLGRSDRDLFPPEEAQRRRREDHQTLALDSVVTHEVPLGTGDGRRVLLRTRGPLRDDEGQPFGIFELSRDVTERNRVEHALHESDRRFEATFEQAAVGIAHVSPDGRWLRPNGKMCEILGYTAEELQNRSIQDITHPDDRDTDLQLVRRMLGREIETYTLNKRYLHKHGDIVWASLTVSLVWTSAGAPDYFIAVVEDISARKATESALQESEERLLEAKRLAGLGHWRWDLRSGLRTWSEELYAVYGRDPALPPYDFAELERCMTPQSWARLSDAVTTARAYGTAYECDVEVVRPDGTHCWTTARGRAARNGTGDVVLLYGTVQDITPRKLAEVELKRRNAELERFNRAATGREMRMIELKREVNRLSKELGRAVPYEPACVDGAEELEAS